QQNWGGGVAPSGVFDPSSGETITLPPPGSASATSHGMMIARNILDIAPDATLYDLPLIPTRIGRPNVFASTAQMVVRTALETIARIKQKRGRNSAWILVNAWAIFDRSEEIPEGDYTRNTHRKTSRVDGSQVTILGHPLNRVIQLAVDDKID